MLGKERNDDCMGEMEWQAQEKRRVGPPKTTKRRTMEK